MARDYEEYGETQGVFEFNTTRKKITTRMIQEVKCNPIFWLSVCFTIFSIIALIIHSYWSFVFGSLFSTMSLVIGGVCIYLCFLSRFKKPWYQLWKSEVARILFFCFFCMIMQGLFIALNAELLKNHFAGSDPGWKAFPTACRPAKHGVILNCVRSGFGIPNPYISPGLDPVADKSYSQDPAFVMQQITNIAVSHMNCDHIRVGSDWVHFRCLSELFGRPSDLAIHVFPNPGYNATTNDDIQDETAALQVVDGASGNGNATYVWVHSQSRLDEWDRNENDGLVRLLFMYMYLCDTSQGGVNCRKIL